MLIVSGVATGITAIFCGLAALIAMAAALIPGIVYLFVYSYFAWKSDPDRVPAQETRPDSS